MVFPFQSDYPMGTSDPDPERESEPTKAEVKTPEIPKCPNCGEPLTDIHGSDRYCILFEDGQWHKEEECSQLACGNCYSKLNTAPLEDIMRAVGLL